MHQGGQPGCQHHAQPLLLPHHPLHHDSVPDCVLGGGGRLPVQRWHHYCQDDHGILLHCTHHLGESPLSTCDTCVVSGSPCFGVGHHMPCILSLSPTDSLGGYVYNVAQTFAVSNNKAQQSLQQSSATIVELCNSAFELHVVCLWLTKTVWCGLILDNPC